MNPSSAPIPPAVPRVHGRFTRWLGRSLLRLFGWRLAGELPDQPRLVMIVAPHSSNWDFIWGLLAKWTLDLRVQFLAKETLFRGPLGWFIRRVGGVPVDRSAAHGMVDSAASQFASSEQLWLTIAPEGTRSAVARWKSGFWRIARKAGVPILCVGFDYPSRTVSLGPLFFPSDDLETDLQRLRDIYADKRGRNHG